MDAEGLGGPGVDRALGEPQRPSQDGVLLQGGPRDVNGCHLSVPLPSGLGSLSSPISTENANTAYSVVVLGLLWPSPEPRWPILSRSRAVLGAQCPSYWLVCMSSVGGPSHLLSQHNSSSPACVKKAGQEAPSRSAQWHSCFLPARLGACAGRGYLCLPVWVAGDCLPWYPRPGCCIL